jgi:hypothetical protein
MRLPCERKQVIRAENRSILQKNSADIILTAKKSLHLHVLKVVAKQLRF